MQVSKLRSGKADGVSAQHTERRLFEITGTASRRSGPVKPSAVLDPERRILCQRTTAKNTSRKWISTRPAVLRPCVEPTWCSSTRGVRVANMSTPLVRKQTLGSSGEQRVNGYRDVRIHLRATPTAHRQNKQPNGRGGEQQNGWQTSPKLVYNNVARQLTSYRIDKDFFRTNSR